MFRVWRREGWGGVGVGVGNGEKGLGEKGAR